MSDGLKPDHKLTALRKQACSSLVGIFTQPKYALSLNTFWRRLFWPKIKVFLGGDKTKLKFPIPTVDGFNLWSDLGISSYWDFFIQRNIYHRKVFTGRERIVVDVGAAESIFSWYVLRRVNRNALIYQFEPLWSFHKNLRSRAEISSPSITQFSCGVGKAEAKVPFYASDNGEMLSTKPDYWATCKPVGHLFVTTLDKALEPLEWVDLLKIDVEGGELEVLQGATKTLKKTSRVLAETIAPEKKIIMDNILSSTGFKPMGKGGVNDYLYVK